MNEVKRFALEGSAGGNRIGLDPRGMYVHITDYDALRAENERLTMQLTACGVVALSNTPDSAAKARNMHSDYMSAACQDVMRAVDTEMSLRAELAALKAVQPVADEREAFEGWWSGRLLPEPLKAPFFMAWKARAALSAPAAGQEPTMHMVQAACAAFRMDISPTQAMHAALCAALAAHKPSLLVECQPAESVQTAHPPAGHTP